MNAFVIPPNAAQPAAEPETAEAPEVVESAGFIRMYSCHPILNLNIGGFQFTKGRLDLTEPADVEKFETELEWFEKNQPTTRALVKTMDLDAAAAFASQFRPDAVRGGSDTSTLRAGQALAAAIGTQPTPPSAESDAG